MRTVDQLRSDLSLYLSEIDRCEAAKCYLALVHVLLALPDVCASLEDDPTSPRLVGDRYVDWCSAHLPASPMVSGDGRYQMRNALLHAGSTTAQISIARITQATRISASLIQIRSTGQCTAWPRPAAQCLMSM